MAHEAQTEAAAAGVPRQAVATVCRAGVSSNSCGGDERGERRAHPSCVGAAMPRVLVKGCRGGT